MMAQTVKRLPIMQETQVRSLGQEDLLEKEMATHSSTVAWKISWMEEPGRLQSMGSQRVGHDWVTSVSMSMSMKWLQFMWKHSHFKVYHCAFKTLFCFWRLLSLVLLMQVWHLIWTRHQVHRCSLCLTTLSGTKTALVQASNFPGGKKLPVIINTFIIWNSKQTILSNLRLNRNRSYRYICSFRDLW